MNLEVCPGCGFFRGKGRDCACCAEDALARPHTIVQKTLLTHRPDGSYVHAGEATCTRCGERFWWIINSLTPILTAAIHLCAAHSVAENLSRVLKHSACRGNQNANT